MNTPVASLPAKWRDEADMKMIDGQGASTHVADALYKVANELQAALASPAIPAIPPGYDRELIARMLFDYSNISGGRYEALSARKQAQLISEADNATGEAVTVSRSPAGEGGKE